MSTNPIAPHKYLSLEQVEQLKADLNARIRTERRSHSGSYTASLNKLIVAVLLNTGLRCSELCALQLRDTPFFHGKPFLYVRDGKGHVTRSVEIPAALVALITAYLSPRTLRSGRQAPAQHPRPSDPSAPLIHTHSGGPICRRGLYLRIRSIGRRAALPFGLHPHMLRHTYATLLLSTSGNLALVQDQLGHRDPETTRIYAQILAPDRTAALSHLPTL